MRRRLDDVPVFDLSIFAPFQMCTPDTAVARLRVPARHADAAIPAAISRFPGLARDSIGIKVRIVRFAVCPDEACGLEMDGVHERAPCLDELREFAPSRRLVDLDAHRPAFGIECNGRMR